MYKKLGQTHLALMNFSWAMDLDPKGANNQIKEAIDKRYLPEDEGETWTLITLKQYRKSNGVEAALKLFFSISLVSG